MNEFETIVIGNGLFGSAATHYLSDFSQNVAVIGSDEPADQTIHDGVFASHYDQRRLVRVLGRSKTWVTAGRLAIENYRNLEAQSGISFYDPVGVLVVKADHLQGSYLESPLELIKRENIAHTYYPVGDRSWRDSFPAYDFPESHWVLHEPAPAGMINPRAMLKAQLTIAQSQGAVAVAQTVTAVKEKNDWVLVTTQEGDTYRAKKVLLTAGSFTNVYDLLPRKLDLQLKGEVIILAEVSETDAARLSTIPTVSFTIDDPNIGDIYLTPPVQYEDGRYYFKMGANCVADPFPSTLAQIQEWFHTGDSDACLPALQQAICAMLPQINFLSFQTKRCIITRTPSKYPMIDQLSDRLFVATGGNGSSAKCADTWGKMAASLVRNGRWLKNMPREPFRAVYL
jgi:sarcosine oxidase